jgi:cytochrome c biogenesis protein CcdA
MESDLRPSHLISNLLFGCGAIFTFVGFIFPGLLWLSITPGDVEMLPLAAITLIGFLGLALLAIAPFRRYFETRSFKEIVKHVEMQDPKSNDVSQ